MPVHAVIFAGRSKVSSGSAMTTFGSISGWKMIFLVWSARVGDHRRRGRLPSRCRRWSAPRRSARCPWHRRASTSPRDPRSRRPDRVWPDMKAIDLADIHARAAAEGDHAVMAARPIGGEAVVEVLQRRIAVDLGEDRDRHVGLLQDVERPGDDRQIDQPRIGDEERPRDAGDLQRLGAIRRSAPARSGPRSDRTSWRAAMGSWSSIVTALWRSAVRRCGRASDVVAEPDRRVDGRSVSRPEPVPRTVTSP